MSRVARSRYPTCPCRERETAPVRYMDCCGRWHKGLNHGEHAPTAEALMRSRYSAYALTQSRDTDLPSLLEYLMKTWHASTVPGKLELGPIRWTGLEVLHSAASGEAATVEFTAFHKENGRAGKLHEISRFVREAGVWLYVDGVDEGPHIAAVRD
jgi:SEC-C motif-containing protein